MLQRASKGKNSNNYFEDSGKDIFDAIIVCDPSRWSRDNLRSKEGLDILKQNGIRFFVGSTEYNLHDPLMEFLLGMSTEVNEFIAKQQTQKSIESRISRANQGEPTSGKLPYGRTSDKKTRKWGINEEEKEKIVWAADQYLAGGSLVKIAETLGMNHSNLWKIMNHRSGTDWVLTFNYSKLNISDKVTMTIPPLLPDATIQQIHDQARANKTYHHGQRKNKYLLSRMIFLC